jgi:hypothetical protein
MKKFVLALFLFVHSFAFSQAWVYHPFPTTTAVWKTEHDNVGNTEVSVTKMYGDTTFSGHAYKKLFSWNGFTQSYEGAIRQDIPNKKVYVLNTAGAERLLYNFNLSVGDTLWNISSVADTFYVTEADSVYVGQWYHKRYKIGTTNPVTLGADLIEGVGSSVGLDSRYELNFENHYSLLCFTTDNNPRLYPAPGYSLYPEQCTLNMGINELEEDNLIQIAPNPVKDNTTITVACTDGYKIEVLNSTGQVILQQNISGSISKTIDFSSFGSGIYFVRLINSNGYFASKKLVKQ